MLELFSKFFSSSKSAKVSKNQVLHASESVQSKTVAAIEEKKSLEQARQVWRQKLDAAANNEALVLELMFASDDAECRLYAAQHVHSKSALEQVRARYKKNDQRVAKLMQSRLETLHQQQALIQAGQDCVNTAKALLASGFVLPNQLAQLDQAKAVVAKKGSLPQALESELSELRTQLDQLVQMQVQAQRQLLDLIASLKSAISEKLTDDVEFAKQLQQVLQVGAASLPSHLVREAERLVEQWQQMSQQVLIKPNMESPQFSDSHTLDSNATAEQKTEQEEAVPTAETVASTPSVSSISQPEFLEALEGIEVALREGSSQKAKGFEKVLQVIDVQAAPKFVNKELRQRLITARKEFAHLMSWAKWSGVASREELVATAEGLAQLRLSPQEIVDTVTALRAQWKQIEQAGGAGSKELWTRFDTACSAAYAPAAQHFQEQSQQRKANTEKAQTFLLEVETRAKALLANADWRQMSNHIAQMRQQWRALGPMERKDKQGLEQRFNAIMDSLYEPLKQQRTEAEQERRQLIQAAKDVNPQSREAADHIRQLQARWQQCAAVVPLERQREQTLWTEFRQACDAVFAIKKSQHQELEQIRQQNFEAKQSICAALELAAQDATVTPAAISIVDARAQLSQLLAAQEAAWQQVGEVARAQERELERCYTQAVAAIKKQMKSFDERQRVQDANAMRNYLQRCFSIEASLAASANQEQLAALQAEQEQSSLGKDVVSKLLRQRWSRLSAARAQSGIAENLPENLHAHAKQLEETLLDLEIYWELPSPSALHEQRRQRQLQLLQQSLKQGRQPAVAQALLERILTTPAAWDEANQARIQDLLQAAVQGAKLN